MGVSGPKVVLEKSSRVEGASKQGVWVPDILEVESKGEGFPRTFWSGTWKEAELVVLERAEL